MLNEVNISSNWSTLALAFLFSACLSCISSVMKSITHRTSCPPKVVSAFHPKKTLSIVVYLSGYVTNKHYKKELNLKSFFYSFLSKYSNTLPLWLSSVILSYLYPGVSCSWCHLFCRDWLVVWPTMHNWHKPS